jgi:hypothetical protein
MKFLIDLFNGKHREIEAKDIRRIEISPDGEITVSVFTDNGTSIGKLEALVFNYKRKWYEKWLGLLTK